MDDTAMPEPPLEELEVSPPDFLPPSIHTPTLLSGASYTHFSPVPPSLLPADTAISSRPECSLGVDEAGRGPVLGPMVYGIFYLPTSLSTPLLRTEHHFDDSKVLTPAVRSSLMQTLCTPDTSLHTSSGWATSVLSARDISSGMLRPHNTSYNLNAQAMDATIELIKGVYERGVNVTEIFVDTIGQPGVYQKKLERVFPTARITVAKKADSLYPVVSAASVCAKVTRDAALETLWKERGGNPEDMEWGSGYPSDQRCVGWMRGNMHPVFGWGTECRFSWGTAKDMLEMKGGVKVDWPEEARDTHKLTDMFGKKEDEDELGTWFGTPAGLEAF